MEKENKVDQTSQVPVGKQITFFLSGWLGLQIIALIAQKLVVLFAGLLDPSLDLESYIKTTSYSMLINALVYGLIIIIFFVVLNKDIRGLFKHKSILFSIIAGIVALIAMLAFNNTYSNIISLLKIKMSDNANESSINSIVGDYPILSLIIFGLIGPIAEEFTYRVGLYSLIRRKSKILGFVITIIIFALIHFDFRTIENIIIYGSSENAIAYLVNELLNIPLYAFAAFAFTFVYEKFGLAASLTAHIANNLLSIGSTIIIGMLS